MRLVLLTSVVCLAACSTGTYPAYVGSIDPTVAPQIAGDMATFVSMRIKPTGGPIQIEQPSGDQSIGPLASDLRENGFSVVSIGGKHRVRYAANSVGANIMARISVDRADGARLYEDKPPVGLSPLGPFSVTEIGE